MSTVIYAYIYAFHCVTSTIQGQVKMPVWFTPHSAQAILPLAIFGGLKLKNILSSHYFLSAVLPPSSYHITLLWRFEYMMVLPGPSECGETLLHLLTLSVLG